MKVLMVGQNYHVVGGSDRHMIDCERLLLDRGIDVAIFCASSDQNMRSEWSSYWPEGADFTNRGVGEAFRFLCNLDAKRRFEKMISDFRPDIIHLHIFYGKITSSIIPVARSAGIPILQTVHEYRLTCPIYTRYRDGDICQLCSVNKQFPVVLNRCRDHSLVKSSMLYLENRVSKLLGYPDAVDRFLCVSGFVRETVVERGLPEEKAHVLHNFVQAVSSQVTDRLTDDVVYFGRLETEKGIDWIIQAAESLPDQRFVIIGTGRESQRFHDQVIQKGLGNVEMTGKLDKNELFERVRRCKVTIAPSLWEEPFNLTIIESFALGKPVICSDRGGMPELVESGRNGFVVSSPAEFIQRISELCGDPELAQRMGKEALLDAKSRFAEDRFADELVEHYRQVLDCALG